MDPHDLRISGIPEDLNRDLGPAMIPGPEEDRPILEGVRVLLAQAEHWRFLKLEYDMPIVTHLQFITLNGILHELQTLGTRVNGLLSIGRGLGGQRQRKINGSKYSHVHSLTAGPPPPHRVLFPFRFDIEAE